MGKKMRVVMHCGRSGSAAHNDRSFLQGQSEEWISEHAAHIRDDGEHVVWSWDGGSDLSASERNFYEHYFSDSLNARNERYLKQRHPERCRTIEELYAADKTRPEEVILQIGDKDSGVSPELQQAGRVERAARWLHAATRRGDSL